MGQTQKDTGTHLALLVSLLAVFVWSYVDCFDLFTWFLEAGPVIIGGAIVITLYRKFPLTNLTYSLIWIHAIILLVGAHYTYARMPLFDWIRDSFELSRNHYDRVGHFAQGFVPAIIAREVLLRKSPLKKGGWLFFLVLCVCLSISAMYELFEWTMAVLTRDASESFLGTQGDVWDTQKDMALCLAGALVSLLTLGKVHDRALSRLLDTGA